MTGSQDDRDLQAVWQSQPPGKDVGSAIALNLIRELAQGFEYRIARRNRREYAGAAVAVAALITAPAFAQQSLKIGLIMLQGDLGQTDRQLGVSAGRHAENCVGVFGDVRSRPGMESPDARVVRGVEAEMPGQVP